MTEESARNSSSYEQKVSMDRNWLDDDCGCLTVLMSRRLRFVKATEASEAIVVKCKIYFGEDETR